MNFKLLALDMDDTLLSDDLSISKKNMEAIQLIEQQGVKIILCSGRAYESMIKYLKPMNRYDMDDYIISFNGALIKKVSGEEVFSDTIEGDVLHDLIDRGRAREIAVQFYNDELIVEKITERVSHYEYLTNMKATLVEDLKTVPKSIKVLYNHYVGEELENLRLELMECYGDTFNIFYSKPNYIEVLGNKCNKGLAVQFLAKKMGIEQKDVMCIGDGFNDVSMIEYAGLGIAVANASDGVKAYADYVTVADNNNHVLWEVYNKFFK